MRIRLVAAVLCALGLGLVAAPSQAVAQHFDATGVTFNFTAEGSVGWGEGAGYSYTYDSVATNGALTLDAVVTISDVHNIDNDNNAGNGLDGLVYVLDYQSGTGDERIVAYADIEAASTSDPGYFTLQLDFVEHGTSTPVIVDNLSFYTTDIDELQFAEFADVASYTLDAATKITVLANEDDASVRSGSLRFAELANLGAEPEDQPFWAEVAVNSGSTFSVRLGSTTTEMALYGLSVGGSAGFTNPEVNGPAATYTVTFDAYGGTVSPASVEWTEGDSALTRPSPTRAGFVFAGWYAEGRVGGAGDSYTPTGNVTLVAVWTPEPVVRSASATVYFDAMSSALRAGSKTKLRSILAAIPEEATDVVVSVKGYVQPTRVRSNDKSLSLARAKRVTAFLKGSGLDGDYTVKALGRSKEAGALGRKVVVTVTYKVVLAK